MPLRVTDAEIHTRPGRTWRGDLQVVGNLLVDPTAPAATPGTVLEACGCSAVPLLVDTVFAAGSPPAAGSFDLVPGNPATFAVVRGTVSASSIRSMLVVRPSNLLAVVVHGQLVARHGEPVRAAGTGTAAVADGLAAADPRLGAWRDEGRDMTQFLTADGRYSETRGGRRDAYTGRFWLDRDHITYLDDAGFWAFGQYHDGVLHHAGFVLEPTPAGDSSRGDPSSPWSSAVGPRRDGG